MLGTPEERKIAAEEWSSAEEHYDDAETDQSYDVSIVCVSTWTYTEIRKLSAKYPSLLIYYREASEERKKVWTAILQGGKPLLHDLISIDCVDDEGEDVSDTIAVEFGIAKTAYNNQDDD